MMFAITNPKNYGSSRYDHREELKKYTEEGP